MQEHRRQSQGWHYQAWCYVMMARGLPKPVVRAMPQPGHGHTAAAGSRLPLTHSSFRCAVILILNEESSVLCKLRLPAELSSM